MATVTKEELVELQYEDMPSKKAQERTHIVNTIKKAAGNGKIDICMNIYWHNQREIEEICIRCKVKRTDWNSTLFEITWGDLYTHPGIRIF